MSKKVLLTGGAGFIGSNLADAYLADGFDVVVVDDLSTGLRENVPDGAVFYEVSIESPEIGDIFCKEKPNYVAHLAAQIDVRKSVENPVFDAQTNILGSLNLLQQTLKHSVDKFVFASTGGAIYGEQDFFPADETHPTRPISPYGVAKLCIERYMHYYHVVHGLNYTALRYANVYGPRQNPHGEAGVVAIFCQKLLEGQAPYIFGSGKQSRDFVYVGDVVRANMLAVKSDFVGSLNVGTALETDVNKLYGLITEKMGLETKAVYAEAKAGEQMRSLIDPCQIYKILGWKPEVDIETGIAKTVEFFKGKGVCSG